MASGSPIVDELFAHLDPYAFGTDGNRPPRRSGSQRRTDRARERAAEAARAAEAEAAEAEAAAAQAAAAQAAAAEAAEVAAAIAAVAAAEANQAAEAAAAEANANADRLLAEAEVAPEAVAPGNEGAAPPHTAAWVPADTAATGRTSRNSGPQPALDGPQVWMGWDAIMGEALPMIKRDLEAKRFPWKTTPTLYVVDGSNVFWSSKPEDWPYKYYRNGQPREAYQVTPVKIGNEEKKGPAIVVFKSKEFTRNIMGHKESPVVEQWRRKAFWDFMGRLTRPCPGHPNPSCYTCPVYIITIDIPWAKETWELGIQYTHELKERRQHRDTTRKDGPDKCRMVSGTGTGNVVVGTDGEEYPERKPVDNRQGDGAFTHQHCEYDDVAMSKIYYDLYEGRGLNRASPPSGIYLKHISKDDKALKTNDQTANGGNQIPDTDRFMRRIRDRVIIKLYTMVVPGSC